MIKLKVLIFSFLCSWNLILNAQVPDFDWVKTPSSTGFTWAAAITTDSLGNSYTVGLFQGTTDFDPGPGVFSLNSFNNSVYVLKLSPVGDFIWAKKISGNFVYGSLPAFDIVADTANSIFITGGFSYTIDFDPGVNVSTQTSNGLSDVFVLKLSDSGDFTWVRTFGGPSYDRAHGIDVNDFGDIVVVGRFEDSVDFDPGIPVEYRVSNGLMDGFVCVLDASGSFKWVNSYGSANSNDEIRKATVDSDKNVYITGQFGDSLDLDPGPDTLSYSPEPWMNCFIQKLDSLGNEIWTSVFPWTFALSLRHDGFGSVYATGLFRDSTDFDPGVNTNMFYSVGSSDAFLLKLTEDLGSFEWVRTISGPNSQIARDVDIDGVGNVFWAGDFGGTTNFDPGVSDFSVTSGGFAIWDDAFIEKMTPNGDFVWVHHFGNIGQDQVLAMDVDDFGSIFSCGTFSNLVDFDPGGAVYTEYASPGGGFTHKIKECIPGVSDFYHTTCDSYNWIDGNTYTSSNFEATYSLADSASNGCDSIVKLHLTILNPSFVTDVIATCDPYTWIDGITYTSSNNSATYTLTNALGCDSIISLDLTIITEDTTVVSVSSCDTYTWPANGMTYTASGVYSTMLSNVNGCDSLVYLDLNVNSSNVGSEDIIECGSYFWPASGITYINSASYTMILTNQYGCDSTATLNLTINNPSSSNTIITECENFLWSDGITYTTSGVYTQTLANSLGCDSITTLDLTILPTSSSIDSIQACDSLIWIDGNTYYSSNDTATYTLTNALGCDSIVQLNLYISDPQIYLVDPVTLGATISGATYQWLDCEADYAEIPGETNQYFVAEDNGNYAVIIELNGCIDTTDCLAIDEVDLSEIVFSHELNVYPNPSNGTLTIDFRTFHKNLEVQVLDLNGKVLQEDTFLNNNTFKLDIDQTKGFYILKISTDGQQRFVKILLN